MTTSNEAYVWIWLPEQTAPVVAGKLESENNQYDFFYGQSYLHNQQSIALSPNELPLHGSKRFTSTSGLPFVLRDSLPDAWGRRALTYKTNNANLTDIEMLLLSSSDRIGALHFQSTSDVYQPKYENNIALQELQEAAMRIESGLPLSTELSLALVHGTSIGGARPKATVETNHRKYIAKFSSTTDVLPIVQVEFAAMQLAKICGLNVAPVEMTKVAGKYVLLIERFDRQKRNHDWIRRFMVSALTVLQLSENEGRYASYLDLADIIRQLCRQPRQDLHSLFMRIIFNILIGNTDDHAKNHAFFWDGEQYELTPAYDLCPFPRSGRQATQAMQVGKMGNYSLLANALSSCEYFGYDKNAASTLINEMTEKIKLNWPVVCDQAELTQKQQKLFWQTAILNPYCFYENP